MGGLKLFGLNLKYCFAISEDDLCQIVLILNMERDIFFGIWSSSHITGWCNQWGAGLQCRWGIALSELQMPWYH